MIIRLRSGNTFKAFICYMISGYRDLLVTATYGAVFYHCRKQKSQEQAKIQFKLLESGKMYSPNLKLPGEYWSHSWKMCRGIFNFFKIKNFLGLLVCSLCRSWLFLQYTMSSDAHVWTLLQQWVRVPAIVSLTSVPAVLGVSPLISFPNYQPDPTLFCS